MTTATVTMTTTGTATATIPPQAASTRRGPTAEQDCSMCSGVGGKFVTTDGQTPGKALGDWVPCTGCSGTGKVR